MTVIRAQVIIKTTDNVSENYITNSWCIEVPGDLPSSAEFLEYTTCFKDFYDDWSAYMGLGIAGSGHEIKYYDLEQLVPPNYPVATNTWNLASAPTNAALPSEVALCLSFQGQKVPGFVQSRRRGRVYLGTCAASASNTGRPGTDIITAVSNGAATLTSNLKAASVPATLSVWSVTDSQAVAVSDGWVDNAWDTQRRRGIARTTRTTWDAA